jgi:hypothetical protein
MIAYVSCKNYRFRKERKEADKRNMESDKAFRDSMKIPPRASDGKVETLGDF